MTTLLIVAGIAAAVSLSTARLPWPTLLPKARWWKLTPTTPELDPGAVSYAIGQIRRGRKGAVTILRVGRGGGDSDVWIGVAGASNPENAAAEIAKTGGCQTGEETEPPPIRRDWRWFYSTVWAVPSDDRFPEHRLHDQHQPMRDGSRFAALANQRLNADDVLMITSRFARGGETMNSAALSSVESAAAGWNDVPPPARPRRPAPHPLAAAFAVFATLVALLPAARWAIAGTGTGAAWIGGAVALVGLVGLLSAYRASPVLARAAEGRGVRVPSRAGLITRLVNRGDPPPPPAQLDVGLLAGWLGGGDRTAVTASERLAPAALLESAELLIGTDPAGRNCYMTDRDRQWGVIIFGDPGMGKTTLVRNILAADAQAVADGAQRSIILIETKGEGAAGAAQLLRANGVEPVVVNVARADGPRLELIDWSNPARSARTLTESMKYAYGPGQIFEQSAEVLNAVFEASIAAGSDPDALAQLGYDGLPNIMELGFWMCGGDPENGRQAAADTALRHLEPYDAVLRYTAHLGKYKAENVLEAPRNKLSGQQFARGLWDAGRRQTVNFRTVLDGHHALVLNFGPTAGDTGYTKQTSHRCASMALYMLWDAITLACDSWQSQGRSVALYSDELHALAGEKGGDIEVVGTIAAEGRSRGVMAVFASQWPQQLPEAARLGVMSYGTRAYFRVDNADVAEYAARDLGDTSPSTTELRNLGIGQCAARVRRDEVAQSVFTLHPAKL